METTPEHIEESNSICFRWFLDWKALYWYTLAEFDLEKWCLWIALKPSDWNKIIPFGISTTSLKGSIILEHHFSSEVLLMRKKERKKERKKKRKKERTKERKNERKKERTKERKKERTCCQTMQIQTFETSFFRRRWMFFFFLPMDVWGIWSTASAVRPFTIIKIKHPCYQK